jgi:glycosyltransferase involved in cell wall biosynthesis
MERDRVSHDQRLRSTKVERLRSVVVELAAPAAGRPAAGQTSSGRRLVFVAWRDLASPRAGGSEVLVDELATGMTTRGDKVTLLCGGPTAERPYQVVRSGGPYMQFLRAPTAYWRQLGDCDLLVEVCNGMPFFAPLWARRPMICLVNHMHTELWRLKFPGPVARAGRFAESTVMPWAHRKNLFLTVSNSTADALREVGVPDDRIRQICNGVVRPDPLVPRSAEPLFVALGRLTGYKRVDLLLRLWERVRQITGGRLVIIGDGPERARIEALAGPDVLITGRVSEAEKHRWLCSAWMLLHPALIEGWGIVIAEAAIRGTPAIGFDVPGLRDSVLTGWTGLLVRGESQFAQAWASLALDHDRREAMGLAARLRAERLHWSDAVEGFAQTADEAIARFQDAERRLPGLLPGLLPRLLPGRGPAQLGPRPGQAAGTDARGRAAGRDRSSLRPRCGLRGRRGDRRSGAGQPRAPGGGARLVTGQREPSASAWTPDGALGPCQRRSAGVAGAFGRRGRGHHERADRAPGRSGHRA